MNPEQAPVRLLHLTTGMDIIGRITFNTETNVFSITDPVVPQVRVDPAGSLQVGLMPLSPFGAKTNEPVLISLFHAVYTLDIDDRMKDAYRQFTSGIVTPQAPNLATLLQG